MNPFTDGRLADDFAELVDEYGISAVAEAFAKTYQPRPPINVVTISGYVGMPPFDPDDPDRSQVEVYDHAPVEPDDGTTPIVTPEQQGVIDAAMAVADLWSKTDEGAGVVLDALCDAVDRYRDSTRQVSDE